MGTIAQLCRAVSSQLRHVSTTGKPVKQQFIFSACPHKMTNFGPLMAETVYQFGAPQQISTGFRRLRYCSDVAHRTPIKLCTMFGRLLGCYTMYTFSHDGILPGAKFALRPKSCILLFWQRYARHFGSGRQPNFATWYKEWNYGTFTEGATYIRLGGHHVGHRPAF